MDKTRNKKRSIRKSRKITGGIGAAVLTSKYGVLTKSDWPKIKTLKDLNDYTVNYNNVSYEIGINRNEDKMTWSRVTDEKKNIVGKAFTGNIKSKKWLIGDAISKIYGEEPDFFSKSIDANNLQAAANKSKDTNPLTLIDSSTILEVIFTQEQVTFKHNPTQTDKKIEFGIKINNKIDNWKQKVLDYYLQTINQTKNLSEVGRPGGIINRLATKIATGKSMDAQLLEEKAKRVPIFTEIKDVFTTMPDRAYNEASGELTFKATLLTDGEGGYVVTDIKVAEC